MVVTNVLFCLLQVVAVPIFIGVIASFVAWYIPAEIFNPEVKGIRYNQAIYVESVDDTKEKFELKKKLRRHLYLCNNSPKYAAYNIFYRFEFYDDKDNVVYFESDTFPFIPARQNRISIPLQTLSVNKLATKNVVRGEIQIIYENRYGTKKTSGIYSIKEYTMDKTSYELLSK